MADITYMIGAKDQASAPMKKVEGSMSRLERATKDLGNTSEKSLQKVSVSIGSMLKAAGAIGAVKIAISSFSRFFGMLAESSAAFDVQEEAVRGLTNAIALSGDTLGPTIAQHEAFASSLQRVVNVGDEVTLGLMRKASMLGVSNDKLQDVTKAAIGMSEATGASLEDSLRKVNETISGNTSAFAEFLPQLRSATTDAERLAIVMQTAEKGLAQQADRATTAAGASQRLANSWGDFKEVIGKALAPIKQFIATGLAVLVETIQTAVIPAINAMMPSGEAIAAMMERMRVAVVKAVTFVEVVVTNLGTIWEMAKTSIVLQITGIVENVKHAFTVVIPEYFAWFGRNWVNLLSDAMNLSITVISNAATNIGDILARLWEYVSSGFEGGFQSAMQDIGEIAARSLTEGFEARTESLPEIASRKLTAGEKAMQAKLGKMAGDLGDQYQKKLSERLAPIGEEFALNVGDLGSLAQGKSGKGKSSAELTGTSARLLTRGRTETIQEKLLAKLTEVVKFTKQTANNTEPSESESQDSLRVEVVQ